MSCVSRNENGSIIQADFVQEISHKHHLQTGHVYTYSEISFCYRRNYRILRFKQCVDQRTMRIVSLHGLLKEAQVMAPSLSGAGQFTENRRLLVPMRNGRKILKTKILRCFSLIRHRNLKCVLPQVSSAMNIVLIFPKTCDYCCDLLLGLGFWNQNLRQDYENMRLHGLSREVSADSQSEYVNEPRATSELSSLPFIECYLIQ